MMTQAILSRELHGFVFHCLQEVEREVVEGAYHIGLASAVQAIAANPN
ncbi:hypothetical protein [Methylobacillus flagellatus]|nr:hypothetical protein [Methylobacillus flagellatus]